MLYDARSRMISAGQKSWTVTDDLALRCSLAIKHDITRSNSVLLAANIGDGSFFFFVQGSSSTQTHNFVLCLCSSFFFFYPRFFTLPTFCWELRFTVMLKYSRFPYSFRIFLFILLVHTFIFEYPELVLSEIQKQLKDDVSKRWSSAVE